VFQGYPQGTGGEILKRGGNSPNVNPKTYKRCGEERLLKGGSPGVAVVRLCVVWP